MATQSELERLAVVETQIKEVRKDISAVQKSQQANFDNLSKKIDDLDTRYAPKWVQTVVSGFVAAILLGFVAVMINFFIPAKPLVEIDNNTNKGTTQQEPKESDESSQKPTSNNPSPTVSQNKPPTTNVTINEAEEPTTQPTERQGVVTGLLNNLIPGLDL